MAGRQPGSFLAQLNGLWSRYGLRYVDELTARAVYGLAGLFVAELALAMSGNPLAVWLAWQPWDAGFHPWQVITMYLVTGPSALSALFQLIMVRYLLPALQQTFSRRQVAEAAAASIGAASALALVVTLAGFGTGNVMGTFSLTATGIVLLGLARPHTEIMLYGAVPVRASAMVWAVLAIAAITSLFALGGMASTLLGAHSLGAWLGAWGWWHLRGPGARRRQHANAGRKIERSITRFDVIQGGRNDDLH